MKFNWGTGIFTFIVIFLLLCGAFIIFTLKQGVNLVHKDYYEKGVDFSAEMKVRERSLAYNDKFSIIEMGKYLVVDIEDELSAQIDSGKMLMFRPSDNKEDVEISIEPHSDKITFAKNRMITGRYILKIEWYSAGKKYELNRPLNIK